MRVARLALSSLTRQWVRSSILAALVAISLLVLLTVTELSRISALGLDEAIAADVGAAGTYAATVQTGLGLSNQMLQHAVAQDVDDLVIAEPSVTVSYESSGSDCPPLASLGNVDIAFVTTLAGDPVSLPYGTGLPDEAELCLDGLHIPRMGVYVPDDAGQQAWGTAIFIDPQYRELADRSLADPPSLTIRLVTGQTDDLMEVTDRIQTALTPYSALAGVSVEQVVTVVRLDDGDALARASEAVGLVYDAIGVAVIGLAGLALLVAQTIRTQHRLWFYGLARALGARRHHIVTLVVLDTAVIMLAGVCASLIVAALADPWVSSFARESFNAEASLLTGRLLPVLSLGMTLILLMGTLYPAIVALRQDPVELLEDGRG